MRLLCIDQAHRRAYRTGQMAAGTLARENAWKGLPQEGFATGRIIIRMIYDVTTGFQSPDSRQGEVCSTRSTHVSRAEMPKITRPTGVLTVSLLWTLIQRRNFEPCRRCFLAGLFAPFILTSALVSFLVDGFEKGEKNKGKAKNQNVFDGDISLDLLSNRLVALCTKCSSLSGGRV